MTARATRREIIPAGRVSDLLSRPDADRIATTPQGWDVVVTVYKSRDAMRHFCKGSHRALVKDVVPRNCVTNPAMQVEERP